MSRTDPESVHYSTPDALRRRKPIEITLDGDELAALERLAALEGLSRSRVVGRLVVRADAKASRGATSGHTRRRRAKNHE